MKTADLFDAHENELESCSTQFTLLGGVPFCSGRIATVKCFEDNSLIKSLLASPGNGRILVVDGGGSLRTALMGDIIALSAVNNGWKGVVIFGAIRDSAEIDRLPLHVKALGTNPRKSSKLDLGRVDVPIAFGDARFFPGQWIHSDRDGILTSPTDLKA